MTANSASKVTHSQTENSVRELRGALVAGRWPAKTKLLEVPLAEMLGVSRTPLRAALLQLEQEGLLERIGGGYAVRAVSFSDAIIAIELRGVVEGTAARLAAERRLPTNDLDPIKRTVASLQDVVDRKFFEGYSDLNDCFHDQLARLAGSRLIQREVERASRLPFAAPSAFSSSKSDGQRFQSSLIIGQQQHGALVQAIERGEGARAEALAREHAQLAKTNIEIAYRDRHTNTSDVSQIALISD